MDARTLNRLMNKSSFLLGNSLGPRQETNVMVDLHVLASLHVRLTNMILWKGVSLFVSRFRSRVPSRSFER